VAKIFYSPIFGYLSVSTTFAFLAYLGWYFSPTVTPLLVTLCVLSTLWRIFLNHGFGHRYLSHKSFEMHPWMVHLMAAGLCCNSVGAFYYWVFAHELHHAHCDTEKDIHSPLNLGFWRVQFSILADEFMEELNTMIMSTAKGGADYNSTIDEKLTKHYNANLMWLRKPIYAVLLFAAENIFLILLGIYLGYHPLELLYWIALLPNNITMQAKSLTNSAAHVFGPRPYTGHVEAIQPTCQATNCWWVALLNGGEGWHSNHHAFAKSARHGLLWYEFDAVWITLVILAELGLVWNMVELNETIRVAPRTPETNLKLKTDVFGPRYYLTYEKKNGKSV
jgi:fatty-acid desaturase